MSRESIYVFDDGSLESKILQFELKTSYDITPIKVEPYTTLNQWLKEVIEESDDICKVFLHFPFEDYLTKNIRDEVMEALRLYPKLRIVLWYEQTHRDGLKIRAADYGVKVEEPTKEWKPYESQKVEEVNKDKRQLRKKRTNI